MSAKNRLVMKLIKDIVVVNNVSYSVLECNNLLIKPQIIYSLKKTLKLLKVYNSIDY